MSTLMQPQVAKVLPYEARQKLVRAAQTIVTEHNPMARIVAIESATAIIQLQYPQFFRKEH